MTDSFLSWWAELTWPEAAAFFAALMCVCLGTTILVISMLDAPQRLPRPDQRTKRNGPESVP
jgi:hypothetical protein